MSAPMVERGIDALQTVHAARARGSMRSPIDWPVARGRRPIAMFATTGPEEDTQQSVRKIPPYPC
jgi:hypothetical protein